MHAKKPNCDPVPGCSTWCEGTPKQIQRNDPCAKRLNLEDCHIENFQEDGFYTCVWIEATTRITDYFGSKCVPALEDYGNIGTVCEEDTGCYFGCNGEGWRSTQNSLYAGFFNTNYSTYSQGGLYPYNKIQENMIINSISKEDNIPPTIFLKNREIDTTWPVNIFFAAEDNIELSHAEVEIITSKSTVKIPAKLERKFNDKKAYYSATFNLDESDRQINELNFITTDTYGNSSNSVFQNIQDFDYINDATKNNLYIKTVEDDFTCKKIFGINPINAGINVILVTSGLTEQEMPTNFNIYHEALFEKKPFSEKKEKFNFFVLTSNQKFDYGGFLFSLIKNECGIDIVDQDQVILLQKFLGEDLFGHANIGIATLSAFDFSTSPQISGFLHEFGHSFGRLYDEYTRSSSYLNFSEPIPFALETPFTVNIDKEGCPRWCSGELNKNLEAFKYYEEYWKCAEPHLSDPFATENSEQLLYCWDFWSSNKNNPDYKLDKNLENIDFGVNCQEQAGCFFTSLWGMGSFRSIENGLMNRSGKNSNYGKISEDFIANWIDNYNSEHIQEIVFNDTWGY